MRRGSDHVTRSNDVRPATNKDQLEVKENIILNARDWLERNVLSCAVN